MLKKFDIPETSPLLSSKKVMHLFVSDCKWKKAKASYIE